jgi:uncharacterized protein (DUF2141 family)
MLIKSRVKHGAPPIMTFSYSPLYHNDGVTLCFHDIIPRWKIHMGRKIKGMTLKSIIITLSLISTIIAHAGGFSIAGTILLKDVDKTGKLYICLVTEEIFKTPMRCYRGLIITVNKDIIAMKRAPFAFTGIPAGRYGIRCFLDQNNNGKLDRGMLGPTEPWGMSWKEKRVFQWPRFSDISFDVQSDIGNLKIELE